MNVVTQPSTKECLMQRLVRQRGAAAVVEGMTDEEAERLPYEWDAWARPEQIIPPGEWSTWLVMAGRGFGKSRTSSETARKVVESGARGLITAVSSGKVGRIALIGRTSADVRDTIVEGESGILACSPPNWRPKYVPSKRRVEWPNGALGFCYAADKPDQLRGPQHHLVLADELASWRYPEAWSNAQFGLRLGAHPWSIVTTTPRPTRLIRELATGARNIGQPCPSCKARPFHACAGPHVTRENCRQCIQKERLPACVGHVPSVVISSGSTFDNAPNLAPNFLDEVSRQYEGTRLGRQELYAEVLDDVVGALWTYAQVEAAHMSADDAPKQLGRILVAVDPPKTSNEDGVRKWSNMCGIVVVGSEGRSGYVLDDASAALTPHEWGKKVVALHREYEADAVVAEVNTGEAQVRAIIGAIDPAIRIIPVTSRRGKILRAEPVAALYEQARVRHVGSFPELEDEMCSFTPAMTSSSQSPDRLDALVHGLTELLISPSVGSPKVWRAR